MVSFTKLLTAGLLAASATAVPHGHHHQHQQRSSSSSSKRGAAYNDASAVQTLSGSNGSVSWAYNWNMLANGGLPSNVEFVPMLWGTKMFTGWSAAVQTALYSGSKYIMGFNEPDISAQASMTPSDAVNYYKKYITPLSGKAKLVTPAVTNGEGDAIGLNWMRTFLEQCGSDCGVSVMAVHWYGESASDLQDFVTEALELAQQYSLEDLWVTEFALSQDMSSGAASQESVDFLNKAIPWLDAQAGVGRYAYFMCADGYLLSGNSLSISGQAYLSS